MKILQKNVFQKIIKKIMEANARVEAPQEPARPANQFLADLRAVRHRRWTADRIVRFVQDKALEHARTEPGRRMRIEEEIWAKLRDMAAAREQLREMGFSGFDDEWEEPITVDDDFDDEDPESEGGFYGLEMNLPPVE